MNESKFEKACQEVGGTVGTIIALAIVAVLVYAILYVTVLPLALLIGSILYGIKFHLSKSHLRNDLTDFWLNKDEIAEFRYKYAQLEQCIKNIEDAEDRGNEAGIARNIDGTFSRRSNLGKEIHRIFNENKPLKDSCVIRLKQLRQKPLDEWEKFNTSARTFKAHFIGLLVFSIPAILLIASAIQNGLTTANIKDVSQYFVLTFLEALTIIATFGSVLEDGSYTASNETFLLVGTFITTTLIFFILKIFPRESGSKHSPKPPLVTLKNVQNPTVMETMAIGGDLSDADKNPTSPSKPAKKMSTAATLAILLGSWGIHKFHLGSWGWGFVYLLFSWSGFPTLIGLAEGINYMFMGKEKFNKKYNETPSEPFKW